MLSLSLHCFKGAAPAPRICVRGRGGSFPFAGRGQRSQNFVGVWRKQADGARINSMQNMNKYTEEELDKLLDAYGEVVLTDSYQSPSSAGEEDDAESLSFAVALAKAADDAKAADIQVLCVNRLVHWTSFFIIATAFSSPQINAIRTRILDVAEKQFKKVFTGDVKPNSWTLLDFGEVVVHIFLPQQREFYNLEEFYGNATLVELPFETQQQARNEKLSQDLFLSEY